MASQNEPNATDTSVISASSPRIHTIWGLMCLHSWLSMTVALALVTVQPARIERGTFLLRNTQAGPTPGSPCLLQVTTFAATILGRLQVRGDSFPLTGRACPVTHACAGFTPTPDRGCAFPEDSSSPPNPPVFLFGHIRGPSCRPLLRPSIVCRSVAFTLMNDKGP